MMTGTSENLVTVGLGGCPKAGRLQIVTEQVGDFLFVFNNKNMSASHGSYLPSIGAQQK
jgi:hypothetical protein